MKIQVIGLYLVSLFARPVRVSHGRKLKTRESFKNLSHVFDQFKRKYSCLPYDGDKFNRHEYLIGIEDFNGRTGMYSRQNLLKCNFTILQRILKSIGHQFNGGSSLGSFPTLGLSEAGCEIVTIFTRCQYYVHLYDFVLYRKCFTERRFIECFYIIYNNLKPESIVDEYIYILLEKTAENILRPSQFYNCKEKCIIDTELNIKSNTNICCADFLLDPASILELDLYERTKLLRTLFNVYHCGQNGFELQRKFEEFLEIYKNIYLRGCPLDHHVTAFVIYKICGDITLGKYNATQIDVLFRFLVRYKNSSANCDEARFFCYLTFGTLKK